MRTIIAYLVIYTALVTGAASAHAGAEDQVFQSTQSYVNEAFADNPPNASVLWLDADTRSQLGNLLETRPALRLRYWQQDSRTVWILQDIGKERPITTGIVVNNGAIEDIRVLVFRESRGWEVKHRFFTRQFQQIKLTNNTELNRRIDGITGATLSVKAMTRMASAALYLHQYLDEQSRAETKLAKAD